jgi:hypothetical protein
MSQPTTTSALGSSTPEPPFSPTKVEEMLRQLDKTVRARQLYLANNPTYLKSLESLRRTFEPLWSEVPSIVLTVTESQFRWLDVPVHQQPEKATDSLPWLCYKDGVRELTLSRGFEGDELERFIEIIPRVRRASADEDDLLTLLWEQDFASLAYRYVEVGQESAAELLPGREPGRYDTALGAESAAAAIAELRTAADAQRSGVVSVDDFDSTLYFLDESEIEFIRRAIDAEYALDLRRAVVAMLFDIFELQQDPRIRSEVAAQVSQLLLHLLSAARFEAVGYLLRELRVVLSRARGLDVDLHRQLADIPRRLSAPETLSQLLQQLDDAPDLPPQDELLALFAELDATALETIFAWLSRVRDERLRVLLESAVDRLAEQNTAELVRLISILDGPPLLDVMRRTGALGVAAAVAPLSKISESASREVRLGAVRALVEIGSPGAMQALDRALADPEREVRVAAVRALGSKGHRSSLPRIEAALKSRESRTADLTERMAFFEAYGALCGEGGVPVLDALLNGRSGLLARREGSDVRACAAIALGRVGSPSAHAALQRALMEKDPVVRNAVNRALRGSE